MAANPRLVAQDTTITWDGGQFSVPAGTVVDVPAGSALETAYGASLVSLSAAAAASISNGASPDALVGG